MIFTAYDLTVGKPAKVLVRFTLPLFISIVFQQMYSIADSLIAGRFVGEDALAAVGASNPITNLFNAVAVGCNIGCGVVISQLFGAKKIKSVKTASYTALLSFLVLSIVLTVFGIAFTPQLMRIIDTPENIFDDSALYMKIYLAGFVFLFIYNIANGIFNSLGDSKTSLYFLIFSSVFNVVLDYIFVVYFKMGVGGVAWATFIAQGIAGALSVAVLLKRLKLLRCEGKAELFSSVLLVRIIKICVPSVLQQSFVSVGNVFIQKIINGFGSAVVAGFSAAMKLNVFTINALYTFGNGVSGFTAQNYGAKKYSRIKSGVKTGSILVIATGIVFGAVFLGFSESLIKLFMDGAGTEAMTSGRAFLRVVAPFYGFIGLKLICDGMLRGVSHMKLFMVATFTDLVLRVILAFVLAPSMGYMGVWYSWPIGWCIATVLSVIFYFKTVKEYSIKE